MQGYTRGFTSIDSDRTPSTPVSMSKKQKSKAAQRVARGSVSVVQLCASDYSMEVRWRAQCGTSTGTFSGSSESANANLNRVSVPAATETSPKELPCRPLLIELHGVYSVSFVRMRSCGGGQAEWGE